MHSKTTLKKLSKTYAQERHGHAINPSWVVAVDDPEGHGPTSKHIAKNAQPSDLTAYKSTYYPLLTEATGLPGLICCKLRNK